MSDFIEISADYEEVYRPELKLPNEDSAIKFYVPKETWIAYCAAASEADRLYDELLTFSQEHS